MAQNSRFYPSSQIRWGACVSLWQSHAASRDRYLMQSQDHGVGIKLRVGSSTLLLEGWDGGLSAGSQTNLRYVSTQQ